MSSLMTSEEHFVDHGNVAKMLIDQNYRMAQWKSHVDISFKELHIIIKKLQNEKELKSILDNKEISIITTHFKILRNSCVQNEPAQSYCGSDSNLVVLKSILELVCEPSLRVIPGIQDCLKMIAQFLGNAVVNNNNIQKNLWNALFPSNVFLLMSAMSSTTKDYLFMFLYICIKEKDKLESDDDVSLMKGTLMVCEENRDAELALLLVEHYISFHLVWCLKNLFDDPKLRLFLLDVLTDLLDADSKVVFSFRNDPIPWLINFYETHAKCAMTLQSQDEEAVAMENQLVLKLLNLMCIMSADHERFPSLKISNSLFEFIVYLLTSLPKSQNDAVNVVPFNCANDFKQNLVILIANLCHGNSANQNTIRRLGGIEILLSCCHIDGATPYLPQWAIFAIRNICEGNVENQDYITNLDIKSDRLRTSIRAEDDSKLEYRNGEIHIKPRDANSSN